MTELLDRLTQQRVKFQDLAGPIVPGRYLLLSDAKVNDHANLQTEGDFLCGDATGMIRIGDHSAPYLDRLQEEDEVRFQLVSQSIHQIIDCFGQGGKPPSPLLPSQLLTEEGHLNDLEKALEVLIKKGHLHEISRRPRMDMRYDEQLQAVSQAKRLAPSAHRYLASHSECWQRRTFTGIQPKKIMGLVSEDEYNLYENRVFARLLDRLEKFLNLRLREIEELQKTISDALDLDGSQELNFRLRSALCLIWGETFSEEDTLKAAELLEDTQKTLFYQLKMIKGLMSSGVYPRIPRNAHVPAQLEPTNILTHDTHYRYLFPLWKTLSQATRNFELTQEEQIESQRRLQMNYTDYCRLLIERSLSQLGFEQSITQNNTRFTRAGRKLSLTCDDEAWCLRDEAFDDSIVFCPIATWYSESLEVQVKQQKIVIPCVLSHTSQPEHPSLWLYGQNKSPMQLSPLDFFVEERVITLLNSWLILNNVSLYGKAIAKLPKAVMNAAKKVQGIDADSINHRIRILQPINKSDRQYLFDAFKKESAKDASESFDRLVFALDELSECPVCRSTARFFPWDNRAFKAECTNNSCGLNWSIEHRSGKRSLLLKTRDNTSNVMFQGAGRWFQETDLT